LNLENKKVSAIFEDWKLTHEITPDGQLRNTPALRFGGHGHVLQNASAV